MIRRISKQSDLVIELDIDLTNIESLEIEYYTDKEYSYTINDIGLYLYIPSQELQKMNDGLLKSTIKYSFSNDIYPDSTLDCIINLELLLWLQ